MATASNIKVRSKDIPTIDKVFDMEHGYVLDFSNSAFEAFFRDEFNINIYDHRWGVQGDGKAKRLRYYLLQANKRSALDTLIALWEYRDAIIAARNYPNSLDTSVRDAFFQIIERLRGKPPVRVESAILHKKSHIDTDRASDLVARLRKISELEPQPRGFAFEKFLKEALMHTD